MKKMLVLSTLLSLAMICSCQKQDSATEAQLAQRKTELDAREKALVQREKAVAEREKAIANVRTILPSVQSRGQVPDAAQLKALQGQVRDPAELQAQREKALQQLPPEVRALIPDPSQPKAERERITQQHLDQRQRALEQFQRIQAQMQNRGAMSPAGRMQMDAANQAAIPATTAAPGGVYPGAEATSPSPSPTPQ